MTALDDALTHPDLSRSFVAEVEFVRVINFWTQDTGASPSDTYYFDATLPGDDEYTRTWRIRDFRQDGTEAIYTEVDDLTDCRATEQTFYFDKTLKRIYFHLAFFEKDPFASVFTAKYTLYLGRLDKKLIVPRTTLSAGSPSFVTFNETLHFESRLENFPSISLRVEPMFSDPTQIGGGSFSFVNTDGYFDQLTKYNWNAGTAILKLGVDRPNDEMAYSDYETVGIWRNKTWSKNDNKFTLNVTEIKEKITRKIPSDLYDRDTYPTMLEDNVGDPIPIAYGVIKDAPAACIETGTPRFKVANHAIVSLDEVRVKNQSTGTWDTKSFATRDLPNGEFTLTTADWDVDTEVAVDFTGKPVVGSTTRPMENPSDIVKDLLKTYLGQEDTNLDLTSFTDAYNAQDFGGEGNNRYTQAKISLHIIKEETARSIIGKINEAASSYLYSDAVGKYFYKVFVPVKSEGLTEISTDKLLSFSEQITEDIKTKIVARYAKREQNDWSELYTYEESVGSGSVIQFENEELSPILLDKEILVSNDNSAEYWAQSQSHYHRKPQCKISITIPTREVIKWQPAEFIRLNYSRQSVNKVYEILELRHNLQADTTQIVLGNLHNWEDKPGFWIDDSSPEQTFPARLGGGPVSPWSSAWSGEKKQWARENVGYWTDNNCFADATDEDSYLASVWI